MQMNYNFVIKEEQAVDDNPVVTVIGFRKIIWNLWHNWTQMSTFTGLLS